MRKEYLPFGKPNFSDAEIQAVSRALSCGWIGMGPETIAFEKELENFVEAPYVVTVNSCTSALFLALLVSGIGPEDEVICPSLTWCSTANAALYLGAKVVFCDVSLDTLCVTVDSILEKITSKTKAVMVVHMGGLAVDVVALREKIPAHIEIIEDAAHAIGAKYPNGKPVGSSGNLTCYSFYANKNLSTGEGGAIALHDEKRAERLKTLRQHGLTADAWKRFSHPETALTPILVELGFKMNYTDLNACIGRVQLTRMQEFHNQRISIAKYYTNFLQNNFPLITIQTALGTNSHAHHLFVICLPIETMSITRNEFVLEMRAQNIGASIHYAPLHRMPLYYREGQSLAQTERLAERMVTLPISASMSLDDANDVCEAITLILDK